MRKRFKKILSLTLIAAMAASILMSGCGNKDSKNDTPGAAPTQTDGGEKATGGVSDLTTSVAINPTTTGKQGSSGTEQTGTLTGEPGTEINPVLTDVPMLTGTGNSSEKQGNPSGAAELTGTTGTVSGAAPSEGASFVTGQAKNTPIPTKTESGNGGTAGTKTPTPTKRESGNSGTVGTKTPTPAKSGSGNSGVTVTKAPMPAPTTGNSGTTVTKAPTKAPTKAVNTPTPTLKPTFVSYVTEYRDVETPVYVTTSRSSEGTLVLYEFQHDTAPNYPYITSHVPGYTAAMIQADLDAGFSMRNIFIEACGLIGESYSGNIRYRIGTETESVKYIIGEKYSDGSVKYYPEDECFEASLMGL